jgi:uncharacterized membrane protein
MRRASTVPTVVTAPPGILADVTCDTKVVFAVEGGVVMFAVVIVALGVLAFKMIREEQQEICRDD